MRRESESIADFLIDVVSPALITLLVASLVCFVVEVVYQGQYNLRLQAILCLFVFGAVGIARISQSEGASYASLFAAPLGLVTLIALLRFVEFGGPLAGAGPLFSLGIMIGIWWCAHRLTIDSTVIDQDRDRSGTGLLSALGWEEQTAGDSSNRPATAEHEIAGVSDTQPPAEEASWWERFFADKRRPHAPGTWAFYFSLSALPIFGLGQWFLPANDLEARRWVFRLALVYVASALGLLLSTSFLGLRRYLRQRQLELPLEMAARWLFLGGVFIAGIMLVAFVLPRPLPEYSLAQLLPEVGSRERGTSSWAVGSEGVKNDPQISGTAKKSHSAEPQPQSQQPSSVDSQPTSQTRGEEKQASSTGDPSGSQGQPDPNASPQGGEQQSGGKAEAKQGSGGGSQQGQQDQPRQGQNQADSSQEKKSENPSSGAEPPDQKTLPNSATTPNEKREAAASQSNQAAADPQASRSPGKTETQKQANSQNQQTSSQQQPTASPPSTAPRSNPLAALFSNLPDLLNRLGMLLALVVGAYFAWRHREQLKGAWLQLQAEWQALWAKLFGKRDTQPAAEVAVPPPAAVLPAFANYADPFATGQATRWPLPELLRYSFLALEAWGREHACARQNEQTPLEYAQSVAAEQPNIAAEVQQFALLYGQVAYGKASETKSALEIIHRFWQRLRG